MQNLAALYATFFAVGGSDAAGRGAQEARAPPPTHVVGYPLGRHFNVFSAKFNNKNVLSYLRNEVAEIRG